jgi:hypothetical protein
MSENLIDSVAAQLAPPVTREAVGTASESDGGTDPALPMVPCVPCFADDDAE